MIPHFDFNRIVAELDMDPEDILHLMTVYEPELHRDLQSLDDAADHEDWGALKPLLHKMKGDAANLCLGDFAAVFAAMELATETRNRTELNAGRTEASEMNTVLWEAYRLYAQSCK